jgi:hypothetical protein
MPTQSTQNFNEPPEITFPCMLELIGFTPLLLPLPSSSLLLNAPLLTALRSSKTLYLPEQFKWYGKDYGMPKEMMQTILNLLGKDHALYEEISQFIDLKKPNIVYIPFDWKFQLVM